MSDNLAMTEEESPALHRPRPVATQVAEILRDRINRRHYSPSGQLPSETDLAEWLGVSRATIRTALAALDAEGLIVRKRGAGTFVCKRVVEVTSLTAWDFSRLIADSDRQAAIRVVSADRRPATDHEAFLLQIDPGTEVLALVRVFLADQEPAVHSTNVLPVALIKVPHSAEVYSWPLFRFLEEYCEQECRHTMVDISSALADSTIAKALQIQEGTPVVRFDEVFYNSEDLPLFVAGNYFNDRVIRVRIVRKLERIGGTLAQRCITGVVNGIAETARNP